MSDKRARDASAGQKLVEMEREESGLEDRYIWAVKEASEAEEEIERMLNTGRGEGLELKRIG